MNGHHYTFKLSSYNTSNLLMKKSPGKKYFTKLFRFWGIVIILGIAASITAVEIIGSYRAFNFHSEKIRSDFVSSQQQIIRQEVMRVIALISYEKEQNDTLTKNSIKARIYEAYSIADNIYQQNKSSKNISEIKKMILDALRPIRFEKGKGSFFMVDLDGTGLLLNATPEMEGKSMLHLQDSRGKYVFRDMIKIVQQTDEGFYQHHCRKDEREIYDSRKLSFVKQIKPLNCFIGTALYVEDIEKEIENTLLSTISRIQFGKKGYIFVHGFNGDILVDSGRQFSGTKKLWELFTKNPEKMKSLFAREHTAALAPNGEFIYYTFEKSSSLNITSPKTSFIYGIPELQWLIGAEFYLDEVDTKIAVMQAELSRQIIKKSTLFFIDHLGNSRICSHLVPEIT